MAAAYHLSKGGASVTLLEKGAQLGGNCFGVEVPVDATTTAHIDVGVSDFNVDTFVTFAALLEELGLRWRPIGQSASFTTRDRRTPLWTRDGTLHADARVPSNLPAEIQRFARQSVEVLGDPRFAGWTVDRYLGYRGFDPDFARLYVRPRALGSFPMPNDDPGRFSICGLVRFWKAHGLVGGHGTPRRMAVEGGMHRYVAVLRQRLLDGGVDIRCRTRVLGVRRSRGSAEVHTERETVRGRHVVFATPPRRLLHDAPEVEAQRITALPFTRARVVVHRDASVMPTDGRRWGAYNYAIEDGDRWPRVKPTITFSPRRIQRVPRLPEVFVTMNPPRPLRDVLVETTCIHPTATVDSARILDEIEGLQGRRNTWYCGAWMRAPFLHEQAHATAVEVATRILAERSIAA